MYCIIIIKASKSFLTADNIRNQIEIKVLYKYTNF